MSTRSGESKSAIRIADSNNWIVFGEGVPRAVATEIGGLEGTVAADLGGTRDAWSGADVIFNLVFSGVVGNAAWAAIPETVRYVQALRRRKTPGIPDVDAAAERIRTAARSIYGPDASVKIRALTRSDDGAWECEALVAERTVVARIDPAGLLVAWLEPHDEK